MSASDIPEPPAAARPYVGRSVHPLAACLATLGTAGIYWYFWLYRRYRELRQADVATTAVTPGRAVGLLFVPVLNLFWVCYILCDLSRAVGRLQRARTGRPLVWPYAILVAQLGATLAGIGLLFVAVRSGRVPLRTDATATLGLGLSSAGLPLFWAALVMAQLSLNSVWRGAARASSAASAEADQQVFRRKLAASLGCVVLLWIGLLALVSAGLRAVQLAPARVLQFRLAFESGADDPASDADREETIVRLRSRLDALGPESPWIERDSAPGSIVVTVAGPVHLDALRPLLLRRGQLELREVLEGPFQSRADADSALALADSGAEVVGGAEQLVVARRRPVVTNRDIVAVRARKGFPAWFVEATLTAASSDAFASFTRSHVGRYLAIVLDGRLLAAPVIMSEIAERIAIDGLSRSEAEELAVVLRAGNLPRALVLQSENVVASSRWLGAQLVRTALAALAFALILLAFHRAGRAPRQDRRIVGPPAG